MVSNFMIFQIMIMAMLPIMTFFFTNQIKKSHQILHLLNQIYKLIINKNNNQILFGYIKNSNTKFHCLFIKNGFIIKIEIVNGNILTASSYDAIYFSGRICHNNKPISEFALFRTFFFK
jgi:hypothetical protein